MADLCDHLLTRLQPAPVAGVAASPPVPGRPNPEPDLPGPTPADEGEMPDEGEDGPAVRT